MRHLISLTLFAALVFSTAVPAAHAQDHSRTYQRIRADQDAGRHDRALQKLERAFGEESSWPIEAVVLKANSLAATEKGTEAFALLAGLRTNAGDQESALRAHINRIGDTLPTQTVQVTSNPTGARVSHTESRGPELGTTPVSIELRPGFRGVRVDMDGFASHLADLFVDPALANRLNATLTATTGTLKVYVDQAGLQVSVDGNTHALNDGETVLNSVGAGTHTLTFSKDGNAIHEQPVTITANQEVSATFHHLGTVVPGVEGATLELVEEDAETTSEESSDEDTEEDTETEVDELKLAPGEYTVIFRKPGHYPVRGTVQVQAGQQHLVIAETQEVPTRGSLETWMIVGISTGIAMVATATVLELANLEEQSGMGPLKFSLAGAGGAMLIASGSVLKWIRTERETPSTRDGSLDVRLGVAPTEGGAMLGASGRF